MGFWLWPSLAMIKKWNRPGTGRNPVGRRFTAVVASLFLIASCTGTSAYSRYRSGTSGGYCADCHGAFTDNTSPKGTVFPSNDKHEMHRASTSMGTACNLCHTNGDNRNPFIKSSTGTSNNAGLGCTGCHDGPGLRLHHEANGIDICLDCHATGETALPENTKPPYYGTIDTKANNPCNLIKAANTNENWSVGDFLGLDNDGNNLYDAADFACGSYQMLSTKQEGNNLRITWQTAGGRTDLVQAAVSVLGPYTNVNSGLQIGGIGVVTTNFLDLGAATNRARFYRVKAQP
jgi:hypothetical protein